MRSEHTRVTAFARNRLQVLWHPHTRRCQQADRSPDAILDFQSRRVKRFAKVSGGQIGEVAMVIAVRLDRHTGCRSEEHTSELPSQMRSSYAGFCLKTKKIKHM